MDKSQSDTVRIGLNGFGRIGRTVFRAALDDDRVEIVGINDVMQNDEMAYLAKYDTIMGRLDGIELNDGELVLENAGFSVPLFDKGDPAELPWGELNVDVAFVYGHFPDTRRR
jgi:glyceraldehyde 3-phosphate dehydrogenase